MDVDVGGCVWMMVGVEEIPHTPFSHFPTYLLTLSWLIPDTLSTYLSFSGGLVCALEVCCTVCFAYVVVPLHSRQHLSFVRSHTLEGRLFEVCATTALMLLGCARSVGFSFVDRVRG